MSAKQEKRKTVVIFEEEGTIRISRKSLTRSYKPLSDEECDAKRIHSLMIEFLNKFGRRLFLDDLIDGFFNVSSEKRWEINLRLFLVGHRLFVENRQQFKDALEKAGNEREFLWIAGIS